MQQLTLPDQRSELRLRLRLESSSIDPPRIVVQTRDNRRLAVQCWRPHDPQPAGLHRGQGGALFAENGDRVICCRSVTRRRLIGVGSGCVAVSSERLLPLYFFQTICGDPCCSVGTGGRSD